MFADGTCAICWIRVSFSTRCVRSTKRWRWGVTRAWRKASPPASALRRSTGGARQTAQAVQALVESPPRQVDFLSGCY